MPNPAGSLSDQGGDLRSLTGQRLCFHAGRQTLTRGPPVCLPSRRRARAWVCVASTGLPCKCCPTIIHPLPTATLTPRAASPAPISRQTAGVSSPDPMPAARGAWATSPRAEQAPEGTHTRSQPHTARVPATVARHYNQVLPWIQCVAAYQARATECQTLPIRARSWSWPAQMTQLYSFSQ